MFAMEIKFITNLLVMHHIMLGEFKLVAMLDSRFKVPTMAI
jgi:hypothetical protein